MSFMLNGKQLIKFGRIHYITKELAKVNNVPLRMQGYFNQITAFILKNIIIDHMIKFNEDYKHYIVKETNDETYLKLVKKCKNKNKFNNNFVVNCIFIVIHEFIMDVAKKYRINLIIMALRNELKTIEFIITKTSINFFSVNRDKIKVSHLKKVIKQLIPYELITLVNSEKEKQIEEKRQQKKLRLLEMRNERKEKKRRDMRYEIRESRKTQKINGCYEREQE